jgi:hypothetical protein
MVFASSEEAPLKGRSLRVYPGNRVIAVLDREDREELPLEVAGQLARSLALAVVDGAEVDIDVDRIAGYVQRLAEVIEDAKGIRRGAGAARRGIDQIETAYQNLREDAISLIEGMAAELR